ncbi:hypothetical protein [Roseicella aquatilis]|uniref:Uncharacterized protein n=1 Tax=Roseicella aquatilis TaxID=2527868 RepID=A0A4R4D553_9PROT|nr:hypothetical protein [Roseicella aquatilis]TCZ54265.1 hypothetical protein EXY23_23445 [Roseicella aquatilis]
MTSAPAARSLEQIAQLQQDGLVLLAHLAERPNRALNDRAPPEEGRADPRLLILPPGEIAADPDRFSALVTSVDLLGRAAAPATVTSIRLTRAYLFGGQSGISPREERRAQRLRRLMFALQIGLMLVGLAAMYLLLKVDEGRGLVGQLAQVRGDLDRSYGELGKLDRKADFEVWRYTPGGKERIVAEATGTQPGIPALSAMEVCWPLVEPGPPREGERPAEPEYRLVPAKPQAQGLCSELIQQQKRERLVFSRIGAWNCGMLRLNPLTWGGNPLRWFGGEAPSACERPPADLSPDFADDWRRTELRTREVVLGLTGYALPLLLGGIGGGIYVVRRMHEALRSATVSASDGMASVGRIILAATFGGLLAAVFGPDQPVKLGNVSLSIAAWAFFLGYALETVLKTLDAAIEGVVGRLRPAEPEKKPVPVAPG